MGTKKGDPARLIGQVLAGRYRLEKLLGTGGMGAVYGAAALGDDSGQRVAIKLLDPAVIAPDTIGRFRREARISGEIGHPHIVTVFDFAEADDETPFLVMELLEGRDLETTLASEGPLELRRALAIARQVGSALQAAHNRGIIHRDLKPPNIFLCAAEAGADLVKVVDFGISKIIGSSSVVTRTMATMGTPGYMSPEQAEGRSAEVDARTDVYALGAIVYEMLGGRAPFAGESVPTVLFKVIHQDPPPLRGLRPEIPPAVEAVVHRALAKRLDERFSSMRELVEALEDALVRAGATPLPGPALESPATPAASSVKRAAGGRWALVLIVVVALLAVSGGLVAVLR